MIKLLMNCKINQKRAINCRNKKLMINQKNNLMMD